MATMAVIFKKDCPPPAKKAFIKMLLINGERSGAIMTDKRINADQNSIIKNHIRDRVHELYWNDDINCARTAILCLSELFEITVEPQTIWSAVGLHGAGGYRAQCGIVEGTLMFIGIYLHTLGNTEDEIVSACYDFASAFDGTFGSLRCYELRPTGFSESDPPHMCENLTCKGIEFAYQFILKIRKRPCK